ncbi:hypothetical protein Bca52824_043288 [Brassica carinata]|uniref:Uncharacterized protein n=1 Tax=Brassica carinata TaxID=52824 RepID=A0A8X7S364_BRACI|nr:hypothetical protein Bca52824_043288 [Brassica carinata]
MASEKFGPHLPTIIEAKHIENLYELWGIDYAVEIEAPEDGETPETVRPGYCGAYTLHFQDRGLSFPLPRFLLEALAELRMAFAQMAPNFWRYFLAYGFPGTMILSPRPGRSIIDGIPNRDNRWREKFFVFKINPASVGDFDFERIPREWSDEIELFGHAPMTPELRGLIATLRRGSPRWLSFTVYRIRAAYALPPGENCATPVGPAIPVRPEKGHRNERASEKEALPDRPIESSEAGPVSIAVPVGGARRAPDASAGCAEINSVSSNSPSSGLPLPLRASGEGNSKVVPSACLPDAKRPLRGDFCTTMRYQSLRTPRRDAYVRMVVANAKAMEASNEYAALMEKCLTDFPSKEQVGGHLLTIQQLRKVAIQNDLDLMKEKHRREIEGREATALKERSMARRSLAREYDAVLAVVREKIWKKLEETAAEIRLDQEISLDFDYGVASLSDLSLSRLELPEVYGDSVDHE